MRHHSQNLILSAAQVPPGQAYESRGASDTRSVGARTPSHLVLLFLMAALTGGRKVHAQRGLADLLEAEATVEPTVTGREAPAAQTDAIEQKRQPLPTVTSRKLAETKVREIFKEDLLKATNATSQRSLAQRLIGEAKGIEDPAAKWALLAEAVRLAVVATDVQAANEAIDLMGAVYDVNVRSLRAEAIQKMSTRASPAVADELARECLKAAEVAVAAEDVDSALQFCDTGKQLTRRSRNGQLLKQFVELSNQIKVQEKQEDLKAELLAKHKADPNDKAVCQSLGAHLCFTEGDWKNGLPLLAKGQDDDLRRLASGDLAAGLDAARLSRCGDEWLAWSRRQRGQEKSAGQSRALECYATALAEATGLEKISIQKKLDELVKDDGPIPARTWLADLEPLQVIAPNCGFSTDGMYRDKPYLFSGREVQKSLRLMPHTNKPGVVAYAIPPGAKKLVGAAAVFAQPGLGNPQSPQKFEIRVDGRVIWQGKPLTAGNMSDTFEVIVAGGTRLELVTLSESGTAAFSFWLAPAFTR